VQSPLAVPSTPSGCFGPVTPITLLGGTIVRINTLRPGTILADGSVVTATMRIETGDNEVFSLNGVHVTGDHYVKHGDTWVQVKDHPDATPNPSYEIPYVFCVNTSTKHIAIGDDVFSDWDELHEPDMVAKHLSHHPVNAGCSKSEFSEFGISSDIHRLFEGGLVSETLVSCADGTAVHIDLITVGYMLAGGARVTGVVSVLGADLRQTTSHIGPDLGGNMQAILRGAPHNVFVDSETGKDRSTLFVRSYSHVLPPASQPVLFHLITDKETFTLSNGIVMRDYTACIDFFDLVEK
jgi:hypothetical protein